MRERVAQCCFSARHFPSVVDEWLNMPHQRHPPLPIMPSVQQPTRHRSSPTPIPHLPSNPRSHSASSIKRPPLNVRANTGYAQIKRCTDHASTSLIRFVIDHTCSDTNRISHANVAATKFLMWHANTPMVHPDVPHRQRHQDPTTIVTYTNTSI